jgi:ATP-dependent Lhr-like helicase
MPLTRVGTVKTNTLALAHRGLGFAVETHDGFVSVVTLDEVIDLKRGLQGIVTGGEVELFGDQINLIFEKFHPYLKRDLLQADALSARVDESSLKKSVVESFNICSPNDHKSSSHPAASSPSA